MNDKNNDKKPFDGENPDDKKSLTVLSNGSHAIDGKIYQFSKGDVIHNLPTKHFNSMKNLKTFRHSILPRPK